MSKEYNKVSVKNNMEVNRNSDVETNEQPPTERPKLQGVVSTAPKKVKKSLLSRLITGLVGPDGASNIGGYISEEIVKPAIKNIVVDTAMSGINIAVDAITSGINMAVYGDRGVPNRGPRYGNHHYRPNTNYGNAYSSRPTPTAERTYGREPIAEPRRANVGSSSSRYGVEEYSITQRHDAAHVLTSLTEFADRFGMVSVADYYDLIKVESNYTDNNYGWKHDAITAARIVPLRGEYVIKFPPVELLN